MSLKDFAQSLPDYAKDIRLNVGSLLNEAGLNDQRKFGTILACAHGTGYKPLVEAAEAECTPKLSAEAATAARAAADEARNAGRAGNVSAETESFFLVYAVYSSAADADTVADRLGAATLDVAVRSTEPATQSDADAFDALLETAERAETLWRELEAGENRESHRGGEPGEKAKAPRGVADRGAGGG